MIFVVINKVMCFVYEIASVQSGQCVSLDGENQRRNVYHGKNYYFHRCSLRTLPDFYQSFILMAIK